MAEYSVGSISVLDETRKDLKAPKAGTNASISDVDQIATISVPNGYTKAVADALSHGKASVTNLRLL